MSIFFRSRLSLAIPALLPLVLLFAGQYSVAAPLAQPEQSSDNQGVILPRYPALSPDGKILVFSYQGDLWSIPSEGSGPARRISVHPAYDSAATFSPDGTKIAFNSDRYGRNEIFVMPASGGEPRRMTNYSGGNSVQGWSGDGQKLLLLASREHQRRGPAFYTINSGAHPGREKPLLTISNMVSGSLSPDGSRLIFARGSSDWPRRGYHGAANADIWLYTVATKKFKQITDFDGEDLWPLWLPDGKTIVYVSEKDGTYNLYRENVETGKTTQLTQYKGDGVRYPSIAANGSKVAYEVGDRIATLALDTPNATPKIAPLAISADDKITQNVVGTWTNNASDMTVSPDGEQIALTLQGDLYAVSKDGGKVTRLTDAPQRDDDAVWSADGKTLFYISNRDGNPELYSVTSADPDEPRLSRTLKRTTTRLTKTPEHEHAPQFSPDGKKFAYIRGNGDLLVADTATPQSPKVVLTGNDLSSFTWSPDGKWFAIAREDEEFNSEILILPSDGSKPPVNISMHPRNDYSPAWSPDGTKLFWTSERLDRQQDIYYVYLKKEDDERTQDEWERLREKQKAQKSQKSADTASATPGVTVTITRSDDPPTIDFEDIYERVRRLTTLLGDEGAPVVASGADGHTLIAFRSSATGSPELSLYDFVDGGTRGSTTPPIKRIAAGGTSAAQWTKDGKTLFYLTSNGSIAAATPGGAGEPRAIAYRARYNYNRRALQSATFEEAWQTLNEQFYDPKFHGADWASLRAKYGPWAAAASDPADVYQVIRLMMGHLNSSHIGITGASTPYEAESIPTGALGTVWDESYSGPGLKIARIIKGTPADRTSTKLRPGEIVSAIGGTELTADTDPDELLADTVGERTPLQVTGTDGKKREVIIEPASYGSVRALLYDEWVDQRRELTHQLSKGRLAYLHIQGMNKPSQDKFEQGLYAEAHGKDALLIDVRDNGGGSTADYLLTMLTIPRHAYTIPRDGQPGYPQDRLPLYPWQKPAALLINQNAYSNAEIFAHAFHNIGRGPVIGVPTFGAVISTGARTLLDGSSIRTPGRGWYVFKTGVNEEHTGAQPDRYVDITPEDELAGRDPQLEAAVNLMLARIKATTLPPPIPAQ